MEQQRMGWLDNITDSMDTNLSKLWEIVENRGAWLASVHGTTKSQKWLREWTRVILLLVSWEISTFFFFLRNLHVVIVVQLLSCIWFFATPWTAAHHASLSSTIFQSLLKLMSIESMMPYNHLILFCPLLPLPSIFPKIRVFSNESALCIRWPKLWSFSFSISPSNECSELTSFRIDRFNFFAIQETLKSLFQHHTERIKSSGLSLL